MPNSVDPDETAHYEPSHLDLCCLLKPIIMPVTVKELSRVRSIRSLHLLSQSMLYKHNTLLTLRLILNHFNHFY